MSSENLAVAGRFQASTLLGKLRQDWLAGYAGAYKDWEEAPERLRSAVGKVSTALMATIDPAVMPPGIDPELFRVQAFHIIRARFKGDPLDAARRLLRAEPNRREGGPGWPFGWADVGKKPAAKVWAPLFHGMITGPIWDVIFAAWAALTPETRGVLDRSVGPAPASLDSPEAIAWLDWAADRPGPVGWKLIQAIRGLSDPEADRIATDVISQHEAWVAAGRIIRPGRNNQEIERIPREVLNKVRGLRGVFSDPVEARLAKAGFGNLSYPFSGPVDGLDDDEPYYSRGFALLPADEVDEVSPAVRAGHGELIAVAKLPEPLLVLLDLDLTRPELAFLGLEGTRLRICDWAEPGEKLCYTRVGLDGSVKPMRKVKPGGEPPPEPGEPLVLGPAFASPIADMPWLGWKRYRARIGGSPGWEQHAEVPRSPDNRCPMTFLAQFPHPNGGTAYAFLDPLNLIAAVRTQWD